MGLKRLNYKNNKNSKFLIGIGIFIVLVMIYLSILTISKLTGKSISGLIVGEKFTGNAIKINKLIEQTPISNSLNLISKYSFDDGSANDLISGYNGIFRSSSSIRTKLADKISSGKNGDGAYFDGIDDFIRVDNFEFKDKNGKGEGNDFSVSLWVKSYFDAKSISDSNKGILLWLENPGDLKRGYFSISQNTREGVTSFLLDSDNANYWAYNTVEFESQKEIVNNPKWINIIGTFDSKNEKISLYVDSIKIAEKKVNSDGPLGKGTLFIGKVYNDYYHGVIDDVFIFDKQLNQDEIDEIYLQGAFCPVNENFKCPKGYQLIYGSNSKSVISYYSQPNCKGKEYFYGADSSSVPFRFNDGTPLCVLSASTTKAVSSFVNNECVNIPSLDLTSSQSLKLYSVEEKGECVAPSTGPEKIPDCFAMFNNYPISAQNDEIFSLIDSVGTSNSYLLCSNYQWHVVGPKNIFDFVQENNIHGFCEKIGSWYSVIPKQGNSYWSKTPQEECKSSFGDEEFLPYSCWQYDLDCNQIISKNDLDIFSSFISSCSNDGCIINSNLYDLANQVVPECNGLANTLFELKKSGLNSISLSTMTNIQREITACNNIPSTLSCSSYDFNCDNLVKSSTSSSNKEEGYDDDVLKNLLSSKGINGKISITPQFLGYLYNLECKKPFNYFNFISSKGVLEFSSSTDLNSVNSRILSCKSFKIDLCIDEDGDGYNKSQSGCGIPDCYDANDVYGNKMSPGISEQCDGLDNDCNGLIDDNYVCSVGSYYCDDDADGFYSVFAKGICTTYDCKLGIAPVNGCVFKVGNDCKDNDNSINPGKIEICGNNLDDDCFGGDSSCNPSSNVCVSDKKECRGTKLYTCVNNLWDNGIDSTLCGYTPNNNNNGNGGDDGGGNNRGSTSCSPLWRCTNWSNLEKNCGTRVCTISNNCNKQINKPMEIKSCNSPGPGPICGNGVCDSNEDSISCKVDCPINFECGDGICQEDMGESLDICREDCESKIVNYGWIFWVVFILVIISIVVIAYLIYYRKNKINAA